MNAGTGAWSRNALSRPASSSRSASARAEVVVDPRAPARVPGGYEVVEKFVRLAIAVESLVECLRALGSLYTLSWDVSRRAAISSVLCPSRVISITTRLRSDSSAIAATRRSPARARAPGSPRPGRVPPPGQIESNLPPVDLPSESFSPRRGCPRSAFPPSRAAVVHAGKADAGPHRGAKLALARALERPQHLHQPLERVLDRVVDVVRVHPHPLAGEAEGRHQTTHPVEVERDQHLPRLRCLLPL